MSDQNCARLLYARPENSNASMVDVLIKDLSVTMIKIAWTGQMNSVVEQVIQVVAPQNFAAKVDNALMRN